MILMSAFPRQAIDSGDAMLTDRFFETFERRIEMINKGSVRDACEEVDALGRHAETLESDEAFGVADGWRDASRSAIGEEDAANFGAAVELVTDPRGRSDLVILVRKYEQTRRGRCLPMKATTARRTGGSIAH